jgi:hypothetical protein
VVCHELVTSTGQSGERGKLDIDTMCPCAERMLKA